MIQPPSCDTEIRCEALIYDNDSNDPKVIIVHEQSGKWGLPKGKIKLGETEKACIYREIKEEVNIDLNHFDHTYREIADLPYNITLVEINLRTSAEILADGLEISEVRWVNLKNLVDDVQNNPRLYNSAIKNAIKFLKK